MKSLSALGASLVATLSLCAADPAIPNPLTAQEKADGWTLLLDGKSFSGWTNFKSARVHPGWKVQEGALVRDDPHDAGDLVSPGSLDWFELQRDYNISEGGKSGIMYDISDAGTAAAWASGPEFQLEGNAKAGDPQRCGWLYALYQPPVDPRTGKPLEATQPAGQWNHVRLVIAPDGCVHGINGVKYFTYVLGNDDFRARAAKSRFTSMPLFAESAQGRIALQGDHRRVSFRNTKLRLLPVKP